jgi:hypothetical protein
MHRTNEACGFPAHTGSLHRAEKLQFINITDQLCSRHPPCAGWYLIGLGCHSQVVGQQEVIRVPQALVGGQLRGVARYPCAILSEAKLIR